VPRRFSGENNIKMDCKKFGYDIVDSRPQGHSVVGRFMSIKNKKNTLITTQKYYVRTVTGKLDHNEEVWAENYFTCCANL
jgi:hypothetical protein